MGRLRFKNLITSTVALLVMFVISLAITGATSAKEIDLDVSNYGYGKYTLSAHGTGHDGVYDEDIVTFYYLPLTASYDINPVTGQYIVKVDEYSDDTNSAEIYLEDKLIGTLTRAELEKGDSVMFSLTDKPAGIYTIKVVAKGINGETLYDQPFILTIDYKPSDVPDAGTPDTGGLFQDSNISKEDYLITGIIVFFVLGVVAFGIVAKGRKNSSKKKH